MTKQELSQCYWLNREIEKFTRELQGLEGKEYKGIGLSGMPSSGGISDHVGRLATQKAELHRLIGLKKEELVITRSRTERYIGTIEDERLRDILTLRHINGLAWGQISGELGGSERHVKRLYYNYLKKA